MTHMKTFIAETGLNNILNPRHCIQDLNLTTKVRGKCSHHRVLSHSLNVHCIMAHVDPYPLLHLY